MKPLCIDLFCGLGGWSDGFLAEGYRCVGFDIERHTAVVPDGLPEADGAKHTKPVAKRGWTQGCAIALGMEGPTAQPRTKVLRYPGQLVLQDVRTVHGSQFRDAAVIVASPPCQKYSWLAMPWSNSPDLVRPSGDGWEILNSAAAKELREEWEHEGPDNELFDDCFRIQREACEAAGRYIPMVVENVRGAQPWVGKRDMPLADWLKLSQAEKIRRGRSAWNFGSFHLWGDVPALMPITLKVPPKRAMDDLKYGVRSAAFDHLPVGSGPLGRNAEGEGTRRNVGPGKHLTSPVENADGLNIGGDWFSDPQSTCRKHGSKSSARKQASAMIAKIPPELSRHIARVYYPRELSGASPRVAGAEQSI